MIPLEKQCVSLELAKRLKELGVGMDTLGQAALWHWYYDDAHSKWDIAWYGSDDLIRSSQQVFAAFTSSELGDMLTQKYLAMIHKAPTGDCWTLPMYADHAPGTRGVDHVDTEADARAKMLIYLVENKLVTL
jgi:hypothetical protein